MFDICVVGGGMVGSATALGLASYGYKVAIIEAKMPQAYSPEQGPDMRVSAISAASEQLLQQLGAWQHIMAMRACPYRRLSVWENPECRTDFDASDIHATHLGHIIENRIVQLGLHQAMAGIDNITWFENDPITDIQCQGMPQVILTSGNVVEASLLIGADGARSQVRDAANIGTQGWQYEQQVLAVLIQTDSGQQDITWQQFTPTGPLAFLPLYDNYASLVWYQQSAVVQRLKGLDNAALKNEITTAFPDELVDFEVLDTASFPLTRMHANHYVKGRVVLAGDAAHTINPLAGQGVNLGFRDVKALLDVLCQDSSGSAFYSAERLAQYESKRRHDNLLMMSAMDGLYGLFSNTIGPLKWARNLGLKLANHSGPLKQQVMRYAMGITTPSLTGLIKGTDK